MGRAYKSCAAGLKPRSGTSERSLSDPREHRNPSGPWPATDSAGSGGPQREPGDFLGALLGQPCPRVRVPNTMSSQLGTRADPASPRPPGRSRRCRRRHRGRQCWADRSRCRLVPAPRAPPRRSPAAASRSAPPGTRRPEPRVGACGDPRHGNGRGRRRSDHPRAHRRWEAGVLAGLDVEDLVARVVAPGAMRRR